MIDDLMDDKAWEEDWENDEGRPRRKDRSVSEREE